MKHFTSITTTDGKTVSYDFSNKNVTKTPLAPVLGKTILSHPLFAPFLDLTEKLTNRTENLAMVYTDCDLLSLRIHMGLLGKPNLSDIKKLKNDPLFVQCRGKLPSVATLCRQESAIEKKCQKDRAAWLKGIDPASLGKSDPRRICHPLFDSFNEAMVDVCLDKIANDEWVILDADNTFIETMGKQEESSYCGHNGAKGYFPLLIFMNGHCALVQNAPGATDGRKLLERPLDWMVEKIQSRYPSKKILLRTDGGFNSDKVVGICEKHEIHYLMGFTGNKATLRVMCEELRGKLDSKDAEYFNRLPNEFLTLLYPPEEFKLDFVQQEPRIGRICGRLEGYSAKSWTKPRNIYYRMEHNLEHGEVDFRFVQTNMPKEALVQICSHLGVDRKRTLPEDCIEDRTDAELAIDVYDGLYSQRGNCELRIRTFKESEVGTKLSAKGFFTNWYRLLLAAAVMHIFDSIKSVAFASEKLAKWRKCTFARFLDEIVNVPAQLKVLKRSLTVWIGAISRDVRLAMEAIVDNCT